MRQKMRFTLIALLSLIIAAFYCQLHGQGAVKRDLTQVEFYVGGNLRPAPKYRVRRFREVGNDTSELAGRFHGLAAQDLEQGEYQYALEPELAPPGPAGSYTLIGKVQ